MILLALYDKPLPSKAAAEIAGYVGFYDSETSKTEMAFERKIQEESSKYKTSMF